MTDQQVFNIAEWLLYNKAILLGDLKDKLAAFQERRKQMGSAFFEKVYDAGLEGYLLDQLMYKVMENHRSLTLEDVSVAFQDERVRIILDKHYLKGVTK